MAGDTASAFISPVVGAIEIDKTNRELIAAQSAATAARRDGIEVAAVAVALKKENEKLQEDLFAAKKALHGQVAIRDALKTALSEVAPTHQLVTDVNARKAIREEAESKVTPDSPWWP